MRPKGRALWSNEAFQIAMDLIEFGVLVNVVVRSYDILNSPLRENLNGKMRTRKLALIVQSFQHLKEKL
jgi:hypothetical protein